MIELSAIGSQVEGRQKAETLLSHLLTAEG